MKRILIVCMIAVLSLGCSQTSSSTNTSSVEITSPSPSASPDAEEILEQKVQQKLQAMTLESKIAQMFVLTPEELTGESVVTQAEGITRQAIINYPVGGMIYMQQNLIDSDQVRTMLAHTTTYSQEAVDLPMFTFVDEEGGTVRRISGNLAGIPDIPSMSSLGAQGDLQVIRETGETMGAYLHDLGFTCDFAPDADVLTNPANTVVADRSFGNDAEQVAAMSLALGQGLESKKVYAVYKHFPGHGATAGDTHNGYASSDRTLDELKSDELIPFQSAIDNGASFIMAAHISLPNATSEDVPATLSHELITDLLRNTMGFDGIVITDSMSMGAIVNNYETGDAVVRAVEAGDDMILMPYDFLTAYQALLDSVHNGRISEERINASVARILRVKLSMPRG